MQIQGSSIIGTFNFLVFNNMLSSKKEKVRETGRYGSNYTRNVIDSNQNSAPCSGKGSDIGPGYGHPSVDIHVSLQRELSPLSQWADVGGTAFHTAWP